MLKKWMAMAIALALALSGACLADETAGASDRATIEAALNLKNMDQEWTYSADSDAWTLSVVTAVTRPVIADEEGVSVCVPGAYVTGIDTDGDGAADVTAEGADGAAGSALAVAGIMTTDTRPKEVGVEFACGGVTCRLFCFFIWFWGVDRQAVIL